MKKIFFCHPRLRDYRLPLFNLLNDKHEVTYFFKNKSDISIECPKVYYSVKKRGKVSLFQFIPLRDTIILLKGVLNANIIVSSFSLDIYSLFLIILSKFFRKKIIIWEEISYHSLLKIRKIKRFILLIVLKMVDTFFVLGEIQRKTLIDLGINFNRIYTANENCGITYSKISQEAFKSELFKDKKVLLYFGRLEKFKGIEYLVDAFSELEKLDQSFALLIIGNGNNEENIKSQIQKLNLKNIYIHDSIYDINIKSYIFNNSYIGLLPSIVTDNGHMEGGPIILFEYFSAGLPIIGTDKLGSSNNYLIDGKTGLTIEEKSSKAVVKAIILLDEYIRNGIITKEKVKDFYLKIPNHSFQFKMLDKAINHE